VSSPTATCRDFSMTPNAAGAETRPPVGICDVGWEGRCPHRPWRVEKFQVTRNVAGAETRPPDRDARCCMGGSVSHRPRPVEIFR